MEPVVTAARARRLARVLVSDVAAYAGDQVRIGLEKDDLFERLGGRDRARAHLLPVARRRVDRGARAAVRLRAGRRAGLRPPAGPDSHLVSFVHVVGPELAGKRLDAALARLEPALSRAQVQRLIEQGEVTVAGALAKPAHKLRAGERIEGRVPEPVPVAVAAEAIPLVILHEDADLVVVDKPAGLVVHPAPGHARGTLVNALLHHCRDLSGVGGELRPGIVHRLDKDTSGRAGGREARPRAPRRSPRSSRRTRSTASTWRSCAARRARESGTVDAPIGRHPTDRKRMSTRAARRARRGDALACRGAAARGDAPARAARDRPHAPDPRAPGVDRPAAARRSRLRRRPRAARGARASRARRCTRRCSASTHPTSRRARALRVAAARGSARAAARACDERLEFLRARVLDELGIEHGFGTRASFAATPQDVVYAQQVHGTDARARARSRPAQRDADALWTDEPGRAVGVDTADCVPILIAHASGRFVCRGARGLARQRRAHGRARGAARSSPRRGCRPAELLRRDRPAHRPVLLRGRRARARRDRRAQRVPPRRAPRPRACSTCSR